MCYLLHECRLDKDLQDYNGDSALHDAVRFGHAKVVDILLKAGANPALKNGEGYDPKFLVVVARVGRRRTSRAGAGGGGAGGGAHLRSWSAALRPFLYCLAS